jgi:hypothetical protein
MRNRPNFHLIAVLYFIPVRSWMAPWNLLSNIKMESKYSELKNEPYNNILCGCVYIFILLPLAKPMRVMP